MKEFKCGTVIHSISNCSIIIEKCIGEGAQGKIYEVKYCGRNKVLKWLDKDMYYRGMRTENFRSHVRNISERGMPCSTFITPLEVTEINDDEFGYVMEPIPANYKPVIDFLKNEVEFKSCQVFIDSMLKILSSFRILHASGYFYGDLNDNNVFINPQNGDVLICDTDGISSNQVFSEVRGNPRYTAPETFKDYTKRTAFSDRFSLYSLMFCMICHIFPFEGQSVINTVQDINVHYTNPVFVFDNDNDINRPDPNKQKTAIELWESLPKYIKNLFVDSFSQISINKPSKRPTELQWINSLLRWKNEIIECDYCHQEFIGGTVCPVCQSNKEIQYSLRNEDVSIPGIWDKKIYNTSIGFSNPLDGIIPVARVVKKKTDPSMLGLENCSHTAWKAISTRKESKIVSPGHLIPLKNGIEIDINEKKYIIEYYNNSGESKVCKLSKNSVPKRHLPIIIVADTSGSIKDSKVKELNNSIEEIVEILSRKFMHSDTVPMIGVLEFNSTCHLLCGDNLENLNEDYEFDYLESGGITDIGQALRKLNTVLNRKFLSSNNTLDGILMPMIFFISDGKQPMSFLDIEWEEELKMLKNNRWFTRATKIAIKLEDDNDDVFLNEIVGSSEAVIKSNELYELFTRTLNSVPIITS